MRDPVERFYEKWAEDPESGCWLWDGQLCDGYGRLWVDGRHVRAHRFSYEVHVGPIPDGLVIDHVCRVRSCVNPDHLRVCTDRDNILAPGALSPAKINLEKTRCAHGHPLTGENLNVRRTTGERECKTCRREAKRKYRARGGAH